MNKNIMYNNYIMNYLKNFNLLCEEQEINLIYEGGLLSWFTSKKWSLQKELEILIPIIINKVKLSFTNIKNNEPGELQLIDDTPEEIESIDDGTQTPGFKLTYSLDDDYTKNNLFPFLKTINSFIELNDIYHFLDEPDKNDVKLIIKINANTVNNDIDLSNPNVKVSKLSIEKWIGTIYFNFNCNGIDREKSNIEVGSINVDVKCTNYYGLVNKVLDYLTGVGSQYAKENGFNKTLGESFLNIFGIKSKKKNNGEWDKIEKSDRKNIPGAIIKCIVNLNNNKFKQDDVLDSNKTNNRSNNRYKNISNTNKKLYKRVDKSNNAEYREVIYNLDPILEEMDLVEFNTNILHTKNLNTSINSNIFNNDIDYDDTYWTTAEKHEELYISTDKPITKDYINNASRNNNEYICCTLQPTYLDGSNKKFNKTIQVFFYILDFIQRNKEEDGTEKITYNPKALFNTRFDSPIFKIIITDNNTNEIVYERYYNEPNFNKAEHTICNIIKSEVTKLSLNEKE